jgi:hypothetical protein
MFDVVKMPLEEFRPDSYQEMGLDSYQQIKQAVQA